MHQFSFEVVQTVNVRPLPTVQDTTGVDKELSLVDDKLVSAEISGSDSPGPSLIDPLNLLHPVAKLDIFLNKVVLSLYFLEVFPYLWVI